MRSWHCATVDGHAACPSSSCCASGSGSACAAVAWLPPWSSARLVACCPPRAPPSRAPCPRARASAASRGRGGRAGAWRCAAPSSRRRGRRCDSRGDLCARRAASSATWSARRTAIESARCCGHVGHGGCGVGPSGTAGARAGSGERATRSGRGPWRSVRRVVRQPMTWDLYAERWKRRRKAKWRSIQEVDGSAFVLDIAFVTTLCFGCAS